MRGPKLIAVAVVLSLTLILVGGAPRASGKVIGFDIEMRGLRFIPDQLRVEPGDTVTIRVFNNETGTSHTFDLPAFNVHLGTMASPILPGENRSVVFTADREGVFYFHCSITGHAQDAGGGRWTGMAGQLQVGEPAPAALNPILVAGIVALIAVLGLVAYAVLRKRRG